MSSVSVIMPCHNAGAYLNLAVASVLGQSSCGVNVDLIIVDDASNDQPTLEAIQTARSSLRVQVVTHPVSRGAAAARNTGIRRSSGQYLAFLDADDVWLPHHLATHMSLRNRWQAGFTSTDYDIVDETGALVLRGAIANSAHKGPRLRAEPHFVSDRPRELFIEACPAWTGSVVVDRNLLGSDAFDETRRYAEDVDLWTRLAARGRFAFEPIVTAHHRRNPSSLTRTAAAGTVELALANLYADLTADALFHDLRPLLRRRSAVSYLAAAYSARHDGRRWDSIRFALQAIGQAPLSLKVHKGLLASIAPLRRRR